MIKSIPVLVVVLFFSCSTLENHVKEYKLAGNALGTTYHVTYIGQEINSLDETLDSLIDAVNRSLSTYQENSLISAFNNNNLEQWKAENATTFKNDLYHFLTMVNLSNAITDQTKGAFNASAGELFSYYNQCKKNKVEMQKDTLAKLIASVGMDKMKWNDRDLPIKTSADVTLNFNAIAKGYLVDLMAGYLNTKGINRYLVEVGGEMRVAGTNGEDQLWKIGVNIPRIGADPNAFFEVLELENSGVATSGNYQNFYIVNDQLVGHTINPTTGEAVINNLKSATILNPQCAVADAIATACMVLGLQESKNMIEQDTSLSAYFIYEDNNELKGIYVE